MTIVRRRPQRRRPAPRRGFNLVELLIAISITSTLLTATMVALDASFRAYQATTELASTHTIGRLTMHRILTLIRTSTSFGPFPLNPHDRLVESDFIEFERANGDIMTVRWDEAEEALYVGYNGTEYLLLDGVVAQADPATGDLIPPFTLEYEKGRTLYRATVNLLIVPDDNLSVTIEGNSADSIHLVASAMPRAYAY
ncbi:MAG: PulJ/GspJ family protein [Planctomycetota bacterium]|jgi:prepilin-type N-terminal cleavage/methylation domain-containing protein